MQKTQALHRVGTTTYRTELAYTPYAMHEVANLVIDGDVIPERFILSWYRGADGDWQRNTMGSYAYGYRKGDGSGPRRRLIYAPQLPVLRGWASLLPGLRAEIEQIESGLPE